MWYHGESHGSFIVFFSIFSYRGTGSKEIKDIDLEVKEATDKLSKDVRAACLPKGLLVKFPENNLQTMILSGAKGSQVHC